MTERKVEHELDLGRDTGIFFGVPFAVYAATPGANHSTLKVFERSARHAREEIVHPSDETEAQHFGSAFHAAVLEPERFATEYVKAPKVDRRTKAGREAWAAFEAEFSEREFLREDEWEVAMRMQASAWADPTVRELLSGTGLNEVVVVWDDPITGVRCKARIDRLTTLASWSTVVDLKSTRDASAWAFSRDAAKYGYHTAAAHYLNGVDALAPRERKHLIVALEKERPFAVAVYELDGLALEQGRNDCERWLRMWAEAERTGVWPGYPPGVQSLGLPRWAIKTEDWQRVQD